MDKVLAIILGLFCFGQFTSMAIGNIFLGLSILFAIILGVKNKKELKEYRFSKTEKGILIFIIASFLLCFTSLDVKHSLNVFVNNYIYRVMPLFIVAILARAVLKEKHSLEAKKTIIKLINISILGYTVASCAVIYKALILGVSRPNGFFGNSLTYAAWNCLFVPMIFILFMETESKTEFNKKLLYFVSLMLGIVGTFLNGARGSWLALTIVLLALVIYYGFKGPKKVCATILIFCFVFPVGFGLLYPTEFKKIPVLNRTVKFDLKSDRSSMERIYLWESAINMVKDYPLTGVGLGEFGKMYQEKYILKKAKEPYLNHAHNNFFQVAAETGIIGLGSFLVMFGLIYKDQYSFWRKTKSKYSLIIIAMTTCLLIDGCTQYNFGDSAVIKNYWLMLALFLAANRMITFNKTKLEVKTKKES